MSRVKGWLHKLGSYWSLSLFTAFIVLLIANNFIALPYYVFAPGGAYEISEVIDVPEDKRYDDGGEFLMTTVALRPGRPLHLLYAAVSPTQRIEKREQVSGDLSREEFIRINEAEMAFSQQEAISLAMRKSGFDVRHLGDGALVKSIGEGLPVSDKLSVGDVVTSVNGKKVSLASELTAGIQDLKPGDEVTLEVKAADSSKTDSTEVKTLTIKTVENPQDTKRPMLGVLVTTDNPRLDLPFPVKFKESDIGGPSAGLAFTLALIDALTPGALTGDNKIATTGTIADDGTVGEVGGVAEKSAATPCLIGWTNSVWGSAPEISTAC